VYIASLGGYSGGHTRVGTVVAYPGGIYASLLRWYTRLPTTVGSPPPYYGGYPASLLRFLRTGYSRLSSPGWLFPGLVIPCFLPPAQPGNVKKGDHSARRCLTIGGIREVYPSSIRSCIRLFPRRAEVYARRGIPTLTLLTLLGRECSPTQGFLSS